MRTGIAEKVGGCYCVVIKTDGTSEVRKFAEQDHTAVYDKAREYIGCKWLDNVVVQRVANDVQMVYLVNDNGYADWGNDPKKVNPIATYIYNGGNKPGHYILGDVVMCWLIDTPEGGEFVGMSELAARSIAKETDEKVLPEAKEVVQPPEVLPDPTIRIMSFESTDDLVRHMEGDETVEPKEEVTISGGDGEAQS